MEQIETVSRDINILRFYTNKSSSSLEVNRELNKGGTGKRRISELPDKNERVEKDCMNTAAGSSVGKQDKPIIRASF